MNDVMIDLETGDTLATAVILSIGACRFDAWSEEIEDNAFYRAVTVQSNLDLGRTFSASTLQFWMGQANSAKAVWFDKDAVPLKDALLELSDWIGNRKTYLWSMGANFDEPMLAHAFAQCGVTTPWQFWDVRCMRHQKELPGAKAVYNSVPREGTHHNALDDAIHQARCCQAINRRLFPASFKKVEEVIPLSAAKGKKAQRV